MSADQSLKENVQHGTPLQPMTISRFVSGPGTYYPEHFFVQRHWHHNVEILKINKGTYSLESNLEHYTLEAGDFCFINSGELHELVGHETVTIHDAIIFDPHILDFTYKDEFQENLSSPFLAHITSFPRFLKPEDPLYKRLETLFDQAIALGLEEKSGWYLRVKLLILEIFSELALNDKLSAAANTISATDRERINRYKKIILYIEQHYTQKITLKQLAEEAQCNAQYLCHFFKEIAGLSPIQYLIHYRINKAQEQLKDTTKSILEISMDCGFDNISYFIRQFKRIVGKTPLEYRNS